MKIFTYFKKMNKLGAAMVEYAVILAFVAAVGSSFTDNISPGVNNIVKSVSSMLGLAAGSETVSSVQELALGLFTDTNKCKLEGKSRWNSFGLEIASGANKFLGKHLNSAGINTAFGSDSKIDPDVINALKNDNILPEHINSIKLITIADEMGVTPDKGKSFAATQYILYQDGKSIYLAGTKNLNSITVTTEGGHQTFSEGDNQFQNKFDIGTAHITGTNQKLNNIDPNNHGFVKYQPK